MAKTKPPSPQASRAEQLLTMRHGTAPYDLVPVNRKQRRQLAKGLAREKQKQGGKP